jgi:hypothetical protein
MALRSEPCRGAAGAFSRRAKLRQGVKNMSMLSTGNTQDIATDDALRRQEEFDEESDDDLSWRSSFKRWLREDSPYIIMLLLAVVGVGLRLQVTYWMVITPVYAIICIIAGWRHFDTRQARMQMVITQVLNWLALIVAIYILYNSGVQGVLNINASGLSMLTLLALGTFMAGLQARVWRICALGAVLFLAVPTIGWIDQSILLLVAATVVVIAIGGFTWWLGQRHLRTL